MFFVQILQKKLLRLIDYGLIAEETFADFGKNHKTFFCKHSLPLKYNKLEHYFQSGIVKKSTQS